MEKQPLLTIITINYNNLEGLKKTFESIFNQSFNEFQYIVIDGGSTDGSKKLIENNQENIEFWMSEPDNGVYNAMNKGIQIATGEYINFMNSGDIFYNSEVLHDIVSKLNGTEIIYGNTHYFNSNGYNKIEYPPKKLKFSYFVNNGITHQSTFIKTSLFTDIFLYNENYKICSDWEFFIIAFFKYNVSYQYVNRIISKYDYSGISAQKENHKLYLNEKALILKNKFPGFYDDYIQFQVLNKRSIRKILHLKKYKIPWFLIKVLVFILLAFTPKFNKSY